MVRRGSARAPVGSGCLPVPRLPGTRGRAAVCSIAEPPAQAPSPAEGPSDTYTCARCFDARLGAVRAPFRDLFERAWAFGEQSGLTLRARRRCDEVLRRAVSPPALCCERRRREGSARNERGGKGRSKGPKIRVQQFLRGPEAGEPLRAAAR